MTLTKDYINKYRIVVSEDDRDTDTSTDSDNDEDEEDMDVDPDQVVDMPESDVPEENVNPSASPEGEDPDGMK